MMPSLLRLTIDNVGLIAHADVAFGDAFTAFTGETGSGKTMLLGALDAVLGGRTERDMVRGDRARVALELSATPDVRALLATMGIELAADDDAVIVRELTSAGRSQARINGVAVSASQLRTVGAHVVDAVGQGEAQRLLEPSFARDLLDRFAGPATLAVRERLRERFEERRLLREERDVLRDGGDRALAEREFARFARGEIESAKLEEGEDDRLRERREVLGNAEKIAQALAHARAGLEHERGAVDTLGDAAHALGALGKYGAAFSALGESAAALQADANTLAADIARALDDVELDPAELEFVTARLDAIEQLKKKYGASIPAVLASRDRFAATLESDAGRDERVISIERELGVLDSGVTADAGALHAARSAAIPACEALVAEELHALAMPSARFAIALESLDAIAAHGGDRVEFRFSANPGEPERPLARIASGGERSRVLLALVVVLSHDRDARAFVFDEIDAGIGGATAVAVGARLQRLASVAQVVCVTHLAQIASYAGTHYALRKYEDGGDTTIEVVPLVADDDRLAEIARMLSGDTKQISLDHAATLVASTRGR